MAEALGWGLPGRPCWTISGGGTATGGAEPIANAANRAELRVATRGQGRPSDEFDPARPPSRVLTGKSDSWTLHTNRCQWAYDRPATTIVGSFSPETVSPPTWRGPGDGPRQNQPGAIKITIRDALILQSFPPDYPVQGTKTKQFEQVGRRVAGLRSSCTYIVRTRHGGAMGSTGREYPTGACTGRQFDSARLHWIYRIGYGPSIHGSASA